MSTSGELVYYARYGDDLIKIGYTRDFSRRMRSLSPDDVLAVEPGPRQVERARHKQFSAERIVNEMFRPSPGLLAHIAELREQHEIPARGRLRGKDAAILADPANAELVATVRQVKARREEVFAECGQVVAELRRRGETWRRIGEVVGVPPDTARYWAKDYLPVATGGGLDV